MRRPTPFDLFAWSVIAVGTGLLLVSPPWGILSTAEGMALVSFTLAAELGRVPLPRGGGAVSVGFAILFGSALIYGAPVAIWLAALGTFSLKELTGKIPLRGILFNRAQLAIAAGLAALTFQALGGRPGSMDVSRHLWPIMAAVGAYFVVNMGMVMLYVSLGKGMSFRDQWAVNFRWAVPNYLVQAPVAVGLASLHRSSGIFSYFLIIGPLLLIRYDLQRFIDRRNMFLQTIRALGAILEGKDPYTKGHSDRVGRFAGALARRLGFPEEQAERLEFTGLLHDIGKLIVHRRVINKKGRLTPEEFAEMKMHPVNGSEILKQVRLLGGGFRWVRHHHERLDGEGYPDGLRGGEIPLEARIILVADAFDAMTSNRSYRSAFGYDLAVEELRRHAGTQFDPRVIEAMIDLSRDFSPVAPVTGGNAP